MRLILLLMMVSATAMAGDPEMKQQLVGGGKSNDETIVLKAMERASAAGLIAPEDGSLFRKDGMSGNSAIAVRYKGSSDRQRAISRRISFREKSFGSCFSGVTPYPPSRSR